MAMLSYFTLGKPKWVKGLKEAYWGKELESGGLQVGLLEDGSDTESVLGTEYGEEGEEEVYKVPSLMDLCSRLLAESPDMLLEMKSRSNLRYVQLIRVVRGGVTGWESTRCDIGGLHCTAIIGVLDEGSGLCDCSGECHE